MRRQCANSISHDLFFFSFSVKSKLTSQASLYIQVSYCGNLCAKSTAGLFPDLPSAVADTSGGASVMVEKYPRF